MATGDAFSEMPQAGSVIGGKYRLERQLSEGSGGMVWEVIDPKRGPVALKILKWSPLKSRQDATERFKNEFSILKSLSHPNISEIYDFGLDPQNDRYYFTSELLTAGDLRSMVGAPIPVVEELLLQALRALEYLRGHKLLHLDIKPQNLLLREAGRHPTLAVIDFGLATFRPPDRPGGTANYMPPEIVVRRLGLEERAFPAPDHRSDLYSLGVSFYYCLTGVKPFLATTPDGARVDAAATLENHLELEPAPPSAHRDEVPAYLDRIIMKLLSRHPDDRYPSAIVAAQAIQYRSPRKHAPETPKTLLAYLPKEGRIIGRRAELSMIENSLAAIAGGTPHAAPVICIAGGRGTGRTRLLEAARPMAQKLEMEVISAEDIEARGSAMARLIAGQGQTPHSPAIALLIDDAQECLLSETAGGNNTFNGADLEALIRRARMQQRLAHTIGPRLALLLAINTDSMDLQRAFAELRLDETICHTVQLRNFSKEEVAEYLTALLGETPDQTVIDQLARCTEGNPLFITEHLEQMIAQGRLFSLAGRPDAKTLAAIGIDFSQSIPSRSMAQSVMERLHQLPEEAGYLALLLACWHRYAGADEIRSTGGDLGNWLLALVRSGLVQRRDVDGRFGFANPLAAQIISDQSNPRLRAKFHDAIGRYLKKSGATSEEIDFHTAYGTRKTQRAEALKRTAEAAIDNHRPLEAAAHIQAMLRIMPKEDLNGRAEALVKLGQAFEVAHHFHQASLTYRKLNRLGPAAFRALSAEHQGLLAMRRRKLGRARKCFHQALGIAEEESLAPPYRLRLENFLAAVDLRDGRIEDAVARFEHTAEAEKQLGREERSTVTNNELGETLIGLGQVDRAVNILNEELERATQENEFERVAEKHYLLGNALRHDQVHRYGDSLRHYEKGLSLAREHHMVELQVRLLNGLGNLKLVTGKPQEAMEHYREGLRLAQQIESETTSVETMIGMGLASQKMGTSDDTVEYLEAALDFARGPKGEAAGLIRRYLPAIYISLGDAYYQKHELERAEGYLHHALKLDRRQKLTPDIRYSIYGTFAEIHLERGETAKARRIMPTLENIVKSFPPAQEHFAKLSRRMGH